MANFIKNTDIQTKDFEYFTLTIFNGIFFCYFKKIDLMDLAFTQISVERRLEFMEGKTYPCFFDITQVKQTTKEARDYLAVEGNALISASAILVSSPMLKMMANFFIMVNKPKNPTRMFTDKEEALAWLGQFTQKTR
jgi:hypothetical protein